MLLVPRQLLRSGMTGNVPYYGGRFTPAQAYAAAHPTAPGPTTGPPVATGRAPVPAARPLAPAPSAAETESALRDLRDSGVLTPAEYDDLLARTRR